MNTYAKIFSLLVLLLLPMMSLSHDGPVDQDGCHIQVIDGKPVRHCH